MHMALVVAMQSVYLTYFQQCDGSSIIVTTSLHSQYTMHTSFFSKFLHFQVSVEGLWYKQS